jgi:hypothetical protein
MASTGPVSKRPAHGPVRIAAAAITGLALVQLLLVLMFSWSASRAAPHGVPLAVAGPPRAAGAVAAGLGRADPGAFAVTVLPGDAAARSAVTGRQVYAAVSIRPGASTVYTAAAAAPAVAAELGTALPAALKRAAPGTTVRVRDLVPNPPDDPRGAGLPLSLIPICITSIAAGALLALLIRTRGTRIAALLAYSVAAGALSTLAMQTIVGVVTGTWLANASVLALACLAFSAGTAAMAALLGRAGVVVSVLVVFFFGFAFSGVATAWQFVPTPWGQVAQYLPVGALNTALRSVAFFGGASDAPALTVLGAWAALGLAASLLTRRASRVPAHHATPIPA